ncbi:MAG: hypothetical protein QMC81_03820 [Thermoanaerobacterales bacterium]|nr:hypothetical protein [Bacillota bacterium]MDI6906608.1 hypothetical protein [Thermoanaerobacterales bacterium]
MPWSNLNFKVIVITFVLGLALLFGGQYVYQKYGFNQPVKQVLATNPAVAGYTLEEQGPELVINVHLKRTDNLQESYRELRRQVDEAMRGRPYQLVIEDERDDNLREAFYNSQFIIYQAIAQGNFQEMADEVRARARAANATARIYLDSEYVYVQMENGHGYLAEVIPRQTGGSDLQGANGGGLYAQRG